MSVLQNIRFLNVFNRFTQQIGKEQNPMKWIPSILALVAAASSIYSPQLQHFMSVHPAIAGTIGSVFAIVSHWLPSPVPAPATN